MSVGIKVCGVTRLEDAELTLNLGVEFLGLNFWPDSPRAVAIDRAQEIAEVVRGRTTLVGVFVNQPGRWVQEVARKVGLDLLQFHGDESAVELAPFGSRAIKALRVAEDFDPSQLAAYPSVWGFLFDCAHPTLYGGSGQAWPYERLSRIESSQRVIVAGGLSPANVARAVAVSGADIVDVCSGVESQPGIKDAELMWQFVNEVRHAKKAE
jgi:phosphoribosylanthranilate isomerase